MAKYVKTEQGYIDTSIFAPAPFKPEGKSYLTFSSPKSFTLKVYDATKRWNGILEYFSADKVWAVWDGTTILSAYNNDGEYVLYLRGTGNTVITIPTDDYNWILAGSDIKCIGNIESLLDYALVASGVHPTMGINCYSNMFKGCASLTKAPELPARKLSKNCYYGMFQGCTSLTQAPALPATTLAEDCYNYMFSDCTSLTKAPSLPATKLSMYCYHHMFSYCTSLTQAPALPATTLANYCYKDMFNGCTSLTQAPALPATTLAGHCYRSMFSVCTSLTQAPALPATTLANYCYCSMFSGCTSLTQAPVLPATTLAIGCYQSMFFGCISLTQSPTLPATTLANNCYERMFRGCTSLAQSPALPATTLANYCYCDMFESCTALKLSSTKTGEYTQEYRIPTTGTGTTATEALTNMFVSTGGTFTGTPEINTTYYLSTDNMIVRDTEVDTLNGYVGSMIDNSDSNSLNITGATVGQIAKISAVDDSGKPIAWEPVDMPSVGGGHWETVLDTVWAQDVINPTAYDAATGIFTCASGELNNLALDTEYVFFQQCAKEGVEYNTILNNDIVKVTKLSDTTFSIDRTPPTTFVPTNVKFSRGACLAVTDIDAKKIRLTLDGQFHPTVTFYNSPFYGAETPYFGRNTGYQQISNAYQAYQQVTVEVESPYRIVGEILCGFNAPSKNGNFHFKNNSFCCPLVPSLVTGEYLFNSDGMKIMKLYSTSTPWHIGSGSNNIAVENDYLKIISGTKVKLERWVE